MKNKDQEIKNSLNDFRKLEVNSDWSNDTLHILKNIPEDVTKIKTRKYRKIDNLIFKLLSMGRRKLALLSLVGITMVSVVSYLVISGIKSVDHNLVYVTGTEKDQVLEEIAKNNPLLIDEESGAVPEDFNYSYMKATWTNGPQYSQCVLFGSSAGTYFDYNEDTASYESWTFYKNMIESSFKTQISDKDGNIQVIYISNNLDPSKSSTYRYEGGDYAVKQEILNMYPTDYETDDSFVIEGDEYDPINDSLSDYETFIQNYFNQIPNLLKDEENNYILEYSYSVNCSENFAELRANGSEKTTNKMITRDYISKTNFQIFKSESYLDKVSSSNLVRETNYTYDLKETTPEEIVNEFNEPADIPVKVLESMDFNNPPFDEVDREELISRIVDVIKENDIPIFYLSEDNYSNSIYKPESFTGVMELNNITDRAFYADNEIGQNAYEQVIEFAEQDDYRLALLQLSITPIFDEYSDINTVPLSDMFNFNYYDNSKDIEKFKESNTNDMSDDYIGTETKTIEIDGISFEFIIDDYEIETGNPNSKFGGEGTPDKEYLYDCKEDTCKFHAYTIIIKTENGFYAYDGLWIKNKGELDKLLNTNFQILEPSNPADMQKIEQLVERSVMIGG